MVEDRYSYFESVFRDFYPKLYFYALNLINDPSQAEDIVEDVFTQVWEGFDFLISDQKPVSPLLYTLTRNRCLDHLRHRDVRNRYEDSLIHELYLQDDDPADHQERIDRIMGCIRQLPPQTQRVFRACFLEEKRYKEVAEEMNISVNTVKTFVSRALSYIRNEANGGPKHESWIKKAMLFVTYLLLPYVI